VWGGLNAAMFIPIFLQGKNKNDIAFGSSMIPGWKDLIKMASTFVGVCLAWVFFRAENVSVASEILFKIVTLEGSVELYNCKCSQ
jgi:D-alanyl-lipoteichoic acid acyltransferase DltB (MBOAT superfamily)